MKFGLKHLLLSTALVAVIAPVASAQGNPFDRGRHVGVLDRGQPDYDPEPMRSGAFSIMASLLASAEYNDNVFAQPNDKTEDTILRIQPEVSATSNWSVHSLSAGVSLDHRQYASEDTETTTDYLGFVSGRLDATRNVTLSANVNAGQQTEARYEPGSQAPEPAQNQYLGVDVGAKYASDRLMLDGQVGTRDNNYQDFYPQRDVTESFGRVRASYAISPDVAVFAQARETNFDYDNSAGVERDGSQTTLQVGVNFELAAPFRGEVSVGQVTDQRDAPGSTDVESLSLDAAVLWFPTQLTTVTFHGFAGITDPGIAEALSAETQRFSVRADHELLRNFLLYAEVGYGTYKFNAAPNAPVGFDREDSYYDIGVGAAYKLNKHAHVVAGYVMHSRDTSGIISDDVQQNVFSIGLKVFP